MKEVSRILSLVACLIAAAPTCSWADDLRPAFLNVSETDTQRVTVTWKQPIVAGRVSNLTPKLSGGGLDRSPDHSRSDGRFLFQTWGLTLTDSETIEGQRLTISGDEIVPRDVLVSFSSLDSGGLVTVTRAGAKPVLITSDVGFGHEIPKYLELGIAHIMAGVDHLLFVLMLVLIVPGIRTLLLTITAFTIAHSLTLALTVLEAFAVPPTLVEPLIALSIVFMALEVVKADKNTLTRRYPWLVAFLFGLIHGFGFADVLREIGLPDGAVAVSLALFNIGVELGQVLFIGLVIALLSIIERLSRPLDEFWSGNGVRLTGYIGGCAGTYFFLQRTLVVL